MRDGRYLRYSELGPREKILGYFWLVGFVYRPLSRLDEICKDVQSNPLSFSLLYAIYFLDLYTGESQFTS